MGENFKVTLGSSSVPVSALEQQRGASLSLITGGQGATGVYSWSACCVSAWAASSAPSLCLWCHISGENMASSWTTRVWFVELLPCARNFDFSHSFSFYDGSIFVLIPKGGKLAKEGVTYNSRPVATWEMELHYQFLKPVLSVIVLYSQLRASAHPRLGTLGMKTHHIDGEQTHSFGSGASMAGGVQESCFPFCSKAELEGFPSTCINSCPEFCH